jgi:hypothetical protein
MLDVDLSLLITGGTGTGQWTAIPSSRLSSDPADTGYYDTTFGPTRNYMDSSGLFDGGSEVTFTYGVPQIFHLSLLAGIFIDKPSARFESAISSFAGVQVRGADGSFITGPVISISEVPEPSFSMVIGLSLLAAAVCRRSLPAVPLQLRQCRM